MACIPAGSFVMGTGHAHDCTQPENRRHRTQWGPARTVTLDDYFMDLTEVTYGAYQACVASGACTRAEPAYADFNHSDQPMTGVTWYQAQKYCISVGKRLPTEAEWEKAARGPGGADTPFGSERVTCNQAVIRTSLGRSCGRKKRGANPKKGKVWPVASKPAGHFGLFDMVGNVEEWVADWYTPSWTTCGTACSGHQPQGPCEGQITCSTSKLKVVKGGSWYWDASHANAWHRRPHTPSNRPYHHFGFRCAASVQQAQALDETHTPFAPKIPQY